LRHESAARGTPDVEYFKSASGGKHGSPLKIREEFKDKVMESASDL
jgi:hypothetical protein